MTKRSITVGFGLSFLILSLATFLIRDNVSKQQPSFGNATVLQGEADSAIPPGFGSSTIQSSNGIRIAMIVAG